MKIRINNLLPILVVLILAVLTLWLRQAAEQTAGDERRVSDTEPEAIVQNLSIVRLDVNGVAQYSMSARRMLHFAANDSTVLETPRFERRDGDGVRTIITANRGKLSSGSKEAFFYGDVRLDRLWPRRRRLDSGPGLGSGAPILGRQGSGRHTILLR